MIIELGKNSSAYRPKKCDHVVTPDELAEMVEEYDAALARIKQRRTSRSSQRGGGSGNRMMFRDVRSPAGTSCQSICWHAQAF